MYRTQTLRKGRFSEEGRIYLVTITTNKRRKRFLDWPSGRPVIHALRVADTEGHTTTHAWVVMPDHLHWLFSLERRTLGMVIARLKSRSTVAYNREMGEQGRLWQKGYYDRALRAEESMLDAARYIVANPVRARLVTCVADYPLWDAQGWL